ncbi:MAG: hypothetical protein ACXW1W_02185 [Methylococcaceae bacterium]
MWCKVVSIRCRSSMRRRLPSNVVDYAFTGFCNKAPLWRHQRKYGHSVIIRRIVNWRGVDAELLGQGIAGGFNHDS